VTFARRGLRYVVAAGAFSALTVVMCWPLASIATVSLPAADDAMFSVWRLAWIAHQLGGDPSRLFDANIFHPATNTLAFSDAMLLVGLMASPLFYAGLDAGLIHNVMLLAAIAGSMLCAFALARRLTGSDAAAAIAALIFGFAPYRIAHISHLELQWTMWMPLSMLLLHRVMEQPSPGRGLLLGLSLAAQVLCSVYYGAFLACYLTIAWLALIPFAGAKRRVVYATAAAAVPVLLVAAIYGPPYAQTRNQFGERRADEVRTFSAVPGDYLRVPPENRLLGGAQSGPVPEERSLFPGFVAIALAVFALVPPLSRVNVIYAGLAAVAADLSLGVNGLLFPLMQWSIGVAGSLRSPSRFGVLVLLSIAMLASAGAARLFSKWPRLAPGLAVALSLLCLAEYWSAPLPVRAFDAKPAEIDRWLAAQPPNTVVLELPAPTGPTLWLHELEYQVRSIHHWQKLVNGYSAFAPEHYVRLINELPDFPERHVIAALRAMGVKYVLIHRRFYQPGEFDRLIEAAGASSRLWPVGTFGDGDAQIAVFELNYEAES
jgi:hypothetical protein